MHGIYAADSRDVSVRSAFAALWDAETRGNGRVVAGMLRSSAPVEQTKVYEIGDVERALQGASVFSFDQGMETLTRQLTSALLTQRNVALETGVHVDTLLPPEDGSHMFKVGPVVDLK